MKNNKMAVENAVKTLECALKVSQEKGDVIMCTLIAEALSELKASQHNMHGKSYNLPALCRYVLELLTFLSNL